MKKNTNDILRIDKNQEGILRLILDDPANKNALSEKMMTMLKNNLTDAAAVSYTHLTLPTKRIV